MSACTTSSASTCTALTSGKAPLKLALAASRSEHPGLTAEALARHALTAAVSKGHVPACGLACLLRQQQTLALARKISPDGFGSPTTHA